MKIICRGSTTLVFEDYYEVRRNYECPACSGKWSSVELISTQERIKTLSDILGNFYMAIDTLANSLGVLQSAVKKLNGAVITKVSGAEERLN
jgi:uncharacterized Zn ribbon protein